MSNIEYRFIHADDFELFYELQTNPIIRKYLGGPAKDVKTKFENTLKSESKQHTILVNNVKAGIITIGTHHNGVDKELSYQFLPSFWGQGVAFKAVTMLIKEIDMIVAETQRANTASIKLLQRLGFTFHEELTRFGEVQHIYRYKKIT